MAAQPPSDYVQLKEGAEAEQVEYLAVAEDSYGYAEMVGNGKPPQHKRNFSETSSQGPSTFVPLHQRQPSHSSRHSSDNVRFDMPEYKNAASDDYSHKANGLIGGDTSINPTYGNLSPAPVTVQGSLTVDDLPPPPPAVSEENELPCYAGVHKAPAPPQQCPSTPLAVVSKKEKKADSVLYTQQSIVACSSNKSGGQSGGFSNSSSQDSTLLRAGVGEEVHQRRQFVRTLFCLLFVLFLMSAVSLGLCVYLLLNWPSSTGCSASCGAIDASDGSSIGGSRVTDSVLTTMGPASTGPPPIPANINASLNAIGAAVRSMDGRVLEVEQYRTDLDALALLIQDTRNTLRHNISAVNDLNRARDQAKSSIQSLNNTVREVHENFTEISMNFDRTLRDARIFKNCTSVERGCAVSTDGTQSDRNAFCAGAPMDLPANYELISATCESEHTKISATLQRHYRPATTIVSGYSCNCHVPVALRDGNSFSSRCSIRLLYCESLQSIASP